MVTYHVSQTFSAPRDYVYSWCTDFREDDPKMLGSKMRRRFIERTPGRVTWWVDDGGKVERKPQPIRVVWLRPPDAWHLETCGDGLEIGDYEVKALGPKKARLNMEFAMTLDSRKRAEAVKASRAMQANAGSHWERYARFLERDYKASLERG